MDYQTTVYTAATAVVAASSVTNSGLPIVTGSWTVTKTLSATNGTWSTNGTFTYSWESSSDNVTWGVAAGSATSSTYVVNASDTTKYLRVKVTNTSTSGTGIAYSAPTPKVDSPYNTALPTISGTMQVGLVLTVGSGTWDNSTTPTPSYTYQWQSSSNGIAWTNIASATTSTYTTAFEVANLQVRVSFTNTNSVGAATVNTAAVQGFLPPLATTMPVTSDTATVQSTYVISLTSTADDAIWPSTKSSAYTYQWQRSSDNGSSWTIISGSTSSSYTVASIDVGYKVRLQVSVSTSNGSSSAYSLPSAVIT